MAVPKPVIPQDPKVLDINKYMYAAGVLAGTCYGSYQRRKSTNHKTEVKSAAPEPPKARRAAA
jgi:hypothetical protein